MGFIIQNLQAGDLRHFKELIDVFEQVFEMPPFQRASDSYLQELLTGDSFYVFVAMHEGKVVAGLTAYQLKNYYEEISYLYIFDLGVLGSFQRKGIGRALISAVREFSSSRGFEEVFVQADRADDYALDFYRATGGNEEDVVHFTYNTNPVKRKNS